MVNLYIFNGGGVLTAALEGRLDSAGVDRIEQTFASELLPAGKPAIVDLTQVTFLASLGIRMLLSTAKGLNRAGAKFALFGATPAVMEVLETTALSDIIPVVETKSEAIAVVTA